MKLCKKDLLVNVFKSIEGIFNIYCRSKDMADLLNLQDKGEPPTLRVLFCLLFLVGTDYSTIPKSYGIGYFVRHTCCACKC